MKPFYSKELWDLEVNLEKAKEAVLWKFYPFEGVSKEEMREYEHKKILEQLIVDAKPCPFCGGKNLDFVYTEHQGHGECSFEGRIQCLDCRASKGEVSGYGEPYINDKIESFMKWNKRT
jgi:hypothetical protein